MHCEKDFETFLEEQFRVNIKCWISLFLLSLYSLSCFCWCKRGVLCKQYGASYKYTVLSVFDMTLTKNSKISNLIYCFSVNLMNNKLGGNSWMILWKIFLLPGHCWYGVDIMKEHIADNFEACVWEPSVVKVNALTAACEAATMILSVDETIKSPKSQEAPQAGGMPMGRGMGRPMM